MALAAAPFAAQAETWNIYGWQNHSWEFVDIDGGRSFDRIQSNAGNIGFAASVPTGMNDISVNVRCEQFTYFNHFAGGTGWCNRNSKIGLSHPQMGEIMFATWLLPYNEGVAQWVDPFYDAGADSHTSIMGSVGANTIFYNTGDFDFQASASGPGTGFSGAEFNYAGGGYDTGFNRRQENIIQYWSPNWNGFVFRFAWTAGNRDESAAPAGTGDIDPVIRSASLAYTNGPFWGAVTWQDHEDWTAASVGQMNSSDAESFRIAGRYIMDMGDGMSVQISAMWENLEYEFNGVTSVEKAMSAFGYSNFASSGNLTAIAPAAPYGEDAPTRGMADPFMAVALELAAYDPATLTAMLNSNYPSGDDRAALGTEPEAFNPADNDDGTPNADKVLVLMEKTYAQLNTLFSADANTPLAANDLPTIYSYTDPGDDATSTDDDMVTYGLVDTDDDPDTTDVEVTKPTYRATGGVVADDPFTLADEAVAGTPGNEDTNIYTQVPDDPTTMNDESVDADGNPVYTADAIALRTYLDAWGAAVAGIDLAALEAGDRTATGETATQYDARAKYDALVEAAKAGPAADRAAAQAAYEAEATAYAEAVAAYNDAVAAEQGGVDAAMAAQTAAMAAYNGAKAALEAANSAINDRLEGLHDAAESARLDEELADAMAAYEEAKASHDKAEADRVAAGQGAGSNVKIERDAWMVSGKIKFGGPVDFRFSYMDADDLEVDCVSCSGDWDETAADAWNVGIFYTMPAGTELRLTYSEVDNDRNGTYGQGISGTGLGSPGAEIEMFAVGIVHWFD